MSDATFNFHDTLLLATSFQSLLFVLLLISIKRDLHLSDFFLIGFFLAQAAIPIHLLVSYGEVFREVALGVSPNLFRIFDFAYWVEGPLMLWYTRSLLFKEFRLTRIDILFLLPTAIYIVYSLLTFYSWDGAEKIAYIQQTPELRAPSVPHLIEAAREIIFVAFGFMCLIEIRHARQQIHHRYSNIEKVDFVWLASLVAIFMALRAWSLLVVGVAFLKPNLGVDTFNTMGLTGNYLMFGLINLLIFFSMTRSAVITGKISKKHIHTTHNDEVDADPELAKRIKQHMLDHKPYLDHYLNLEELAKQLSMHPRALSVAIKNNFQANFYEFINSFRTKEAIRLLEDKENPNRTMIEIHGDSGFNSKATFNAIFKKTVGMTPTQYKKSKQAVAHNS
ncbi:MAG: AraC-like DNA-binding protein [Arenicella sp.]